MTTLIKQRHTGFTIIEMAIVLVILGFLVAALLLPLQTQRDIAKQLESEAILANSKKALIGFAQANGRLPCPATDEEVGAFPNGSGTENAISTTDGTCVTNHGFLPATSLGLKPIDSSGFALDAWNQKIRYSITSENDNAFTGEGKMHSVGISELKPGLQVCSKTPTPSTDVCKQGQGLISNAVAVIYSTGPTGGLSDGGPDELANKDTDPVFVSHSPQVEGADTGEFDHIVTWLSPYILYNAMIQAGQLH